MALLLIHQFALGQQQNQLTDTLSLQPLEIIALRATEKAPFAKSELSKTDINKFNTGRDLPFILNYTPAVQISSDAGNGIGYTGIRIRGTDATRINITINGIPYNDAESQGTFLVNLPDLASSACSIQIQRGVGSSTNGTGAFGGTININTNDVDSNKYILINNTAGSYNTLKNTLVMNSGLFNKHFIFNGRVSNISSNGYIDRSQSRLQSFYTSAAYLDNKQSIRLNIFSGKEKTHAAWFGINQATLDTNRTYNPAGTEKSDSPYDNETDNYTQTHYQLFYNRKISPRLQFNLSGFLVTGKGYFEQYKAGQSLSAYNLPDVINGNDTLTSTDLTRQLWLDNKFYGTVFSAQYSKANTNLIFGGTLNRYDGDHFGKIIKTIVPDAAPKDFVWYYVPANKKEFAVYTKWNQKLNTNWESFVDLQFRNVNYKINGFQYNPGLNIKNNFLFFNPKIGLTYTKSKNKFYLSYARSAKEPNRDDFETSPKDAPKPEKLNDFEMGWERKNKKAGYGINLYYMSYKNQLVLTGKVNDVYAYTRTNTPESYRTGIELEGSQKLNNWISVYANLNLSINRINEFTEYLYNEDGALQFVNKHFYKDISYSPAVVGAYHVMCKPFKQTSISLNGKYVGKQFLDNTSNESRKLSAYFVQDIKADYDISFKKNRNVNLFLQVNNIFSEKYTPNGYTFSYIYGGSLTTENYYYPMATINFMAGVNVKW